MNNTATQHVAAVYNRLKDEYDENLATVPFFINCYALFDRLLDRILEGRQFQKTLDLGCGPGIQTVRLARHSKEVVGVDIADDLLRVARDRCRDYLNVRFVKEDARALSFDADSFEAIFAYGDVLSHIVDGYEQAVSEISRVAKPGAMVTFEVDNKWHPGIFYKPIELGLNLLNPGRGHTARTWGGMSFKTFTFRELKRMLERYDLELLECYAHNILASLVPDRFSMERGPRTFFGRLALMLGKLDLACSGVFPFNRMGYNSVILARKRCPAEG